MKVAIHQPHYFPWMGYLDKMAKADKYIVLDEVQLEDRSPMVRNKFLQNNGEEHILGLSIRKKGYREKMTKEIELSDAKDVLAKHSRFIQMNYGKTKGYDEVWPEIEHIFSKDYKYLIELDMDTVYAMRKLFAINTEMILQSDLDYDRSMKKSNLMLALSEAVNADVYLSGRGAKEYMNDEDFIKKSIKVEYQVFSYPVYKQMHSEQFVGNLSALDILMQLGIEDARKVFWDNINDKENEQ